MFLLPVMVSAQHPNVLISTTNFPNEPAICIDTKHPDRIIAAANNDNFYLSTDGGQSWTEGTLTSDWGVWGDPCVLVDTSGHYYFFHLSNPTTGSWIDRIVCQRMDYGTATWSPGTYTYFDQGKQQDKEWAVLNPDNNEIYACWTQFDSYGSLNGTDSTLILFAKSQDGGLSWENMKRISQHAGNCADQDSTVEGAVPAVGPNGEIYVSWSDINGIQFDRSLDGGDTWLEQDIFVCTQPGGWDFNIPGISRCNGMPVTCCDRSNGPYRGNVYINFSDQRNGPDDTDIWLARSTDGGNTWSQSIRINNDPPGKQQFFTWMTVDPLTGYLYVVFYDRRNHSGNATDVYLAVSKDGGVTFFNYLISETPFTPIEDVFFGDYTNISVYGNVIRPIWTRLDITGLSIYTALVDPVILGQEEESLAPFHSESVTPNPFTQTTFFTYKIKKPCLVELKVFDINGKEIACLIPLQTKPAGKYVETFDARSHHLSPGVYFFQLTTSSVITKHQMILVE